MPCCHLSRGILTFQPTQLIALPLPPDLCKKFSLFIYLRWVQDLAAALGENDINTFPLPSHTVSRSNFLKHLKYQNFSHYHYQKLLCLSNKQWVRLNAYNDLRKLLVIAGIETNPGPATTLNTITLSHVNINSITAPNRLQEVMHFVKFNSVDVLAMTETKLDDSIHSSLYTIPNFHQPFTRHRTRPGRGDCIRT